MKKKKRKYFSPEKKQKIVNEFIDSGMTAKDYSKKAGVAAVTLSRWARDYGQSSSVRKSHYSPEQRRLAISEFMKSGMTQKNFARVWGIDQKTLSTWLVAYRKQGNKGLENGTLYGIGKRRGRKPVNIKFKQEIIKTAQALPEFGLKKLQNFLFRFEGIKVAPNTIKKVLEEEDMYEPKLEAKKKKSPPVIRRFERAKPMQLWQTDITSFVLPRSKQRVYLVVFLDDNSRYIVSWSLALKQTGVFVMECLMNGIDRFGKPEEVLSDQGRQYFSWRGRSEFQKLLQQEGIEHVVSRSHHPQTLGKCERFWKTVGIEFWDRANPIDLKEARERFSHYVNHYNHFRPHQGIDGHVPADRFFDLADDIRESVERTFSDNELRVALDKSPRKPFFFVGQVGEKKISMHGEKGQVVVHTPNGDIERIKYEEFGKQNSGRNSEFGGEYNQEKNTQGEQEESTLQDAKTCDSSERFMGSCERRREESSSDASFSDHRILDGIEDEERSGAEAWSETIESVADEPTSSEWDVRSTFEAAEIEEEYDTKGRRPEAFEEEDQGTRGDYRDARQIDSNSEIDAGMPGSHFESEENNVEEEGSKAWQEAEGTIESSKPRSGFGWFRKEDE